MFDYYFSENLKWGHAHGPGETRSTNGLEKGWYYVCEEIKSLMKDNRTNDLGQLGAVLTTINKWPSCISNVPYVVNPVHYMVDWDEIDKMRGGLYAEFRMMVCYDLETDELITECPFSDMSKCKGIICFLPSARTTSCLPELFQSGKNSLDHSRSFKM